MSKYTFEQIVNHLRTSGFVFKALKYMVDYQTLGIMVL